ncbi:hypothetical protein EVAR_12312_1 [Eumeta japonica]|uniref:Uncharacterized protein n=1 Tax=Eumeta variegata TaxID=151549 RepID=A0A4C1TV07_EUMVA|nr:hypothetical protein EVAR_12312_1 [Eumeta japonica]
MTNLVATIKPRASDSSVQKFLPPKYDGTTRYYGKRFSGNASTLLGLGRIAWKDTAIPGRSSAWDKQQLENYGCACPCVPAQKRIGFVQVDTLWISGRNHL